MKIAYEIVRIFDADVFNAGEGDEFRFRLEVIQELRTGRYTGKVYRLETYRLQPTFPQVDGVLPDSKHDALIYVADDVFDQCDLTGSSVQDVVDAFEIKIADLFEIRPPINDV